MAEFIIIRHGQASFGEANYDKLSEAGHTQSELAGEYLAKLGWKPDRVVTGTLSRQIDTAKSMAKSMGFAPAETHAGFNEYDFHDLLHARFDGAVPDLVLGDRKTHFRTLRETVFMWQADEIPNASESWTDFTTRVADALEFATRDGAERVLIASSGGVIGQIAAATMDAPAKMMMTLNLQIKNTAMNKFIFAPNRQFLHEFNATPHLDAPETANLLTYS